LKLGYKSNQQSTYKYLYYNVNIPFTHKSKVVATNNWNGTYTLSGGNRASNEFYVVSVNGTSWTAITNNNGVALTTYSPGKNQTYKFAVSNTSLSPVPYTLTESLAYSSNDELRPVIEIANGGLFTSVAPTTVEQMNDEGEIVANVESLGGNKWVVGVDDITTDVCLNITQPTWWASIPYPCLKVQAVETFADGDTANLTSMDVS